MFLIWIGALLILCGVLLGVAQVLRRGRLSNPRRVGPTGASASLEPRLGQVKAFSLKAHWPALVLIVIGAILILTEAAF
jgi:hypothetical protein